MDSNLDNSWLSNKNISVITFENCIDLWLKMRLNYIANENLIIIENIIEPNIYEYYLRLNSNDFIGTAKLFSASGLLYPPFEKEVCGRDAIAQYLQAEAKTIETYPNFGNILSMDDGSNLYQIKGYVKTSFFRVNVGWSIQLNADKEITVVKVILLAELQDLLALKRT
jgi:hypothetical protein